MPPKSTKRSGSPSIGGQGTMSKKESVAVKQRNNGKTESEDECSDNTSVSPAKPALSRVRQKRKAGQGPPTQSIPDKGTFATSYAGRSSRHVMTKMGKTNLDMHKADVEVASNPELPRTVSNTAMACCPRPGFLSIR
jgi:hypothetical protein